MDDHAEVDALLQNILHNERADFWTQLDRFWARLAVHIRAEHLHLFPAVVTTLGEGHQAARIAATIEVLRADHNFFMIEIGRVMKTRENAHETLRTVAERLTTHNEIEEAEIYPFIRTLLSPESQSELANNIKREIENLPPRFTTLK